MSSVTGLQFGKRTRTYFSKANRLRSAPINQLIAFDELDRAITAVDGWQYIDGIYSIYSSNGRIINFAGGAGAPLFGTDPNNIGAPFIQGVGFAGNAIDAYADTIVVQPALSWQAVFNIDPRNFDAPSIGATNPETGFTDSINPAKSNGKLNVAASSPTLQINNGNIGGGVGLTSKTRVSVGASGVVRVFDSGTYTELPSPYTGDLNGVGKSTTRIGRNGTGTRYDGRLLPFVLIGRLAPLAVEQVILTAIQQWAYDIGFADSTEPPQPELIGANTAWEPGDYANVTPPNIEIVRTGAPPLSDKADDDTTAYCPATTYFGGQGVQETAALSTWTGVPYVPGAWWMSVWDTCGYLRPDGQLKKANSLSGINRSDGLICRPIFGPQVADRDTFDTPEEYAAARLASSLVGIERGMANAEAQLLHQLGYSEEMWRGHAEAAGLTVVTYGDMLTRAALPVNDINQSFPEIAEAGIYAVCRDVMIVLPTRLVDVSIGKVMGIDAEAADGRTAEQQRQHMIRMGTWAHSAGYLFAIYGNGPTAGSQANNGFDPSVYADEELRAAVDYFPMQFRAGTTTGYNDTAAFWEEQYDALSGGRGRPNPMPWDKIYVIVGMGAYGNEISFNATRAIRDKIVENVPRAVMIWDNKGFAGGDGNRVYNQRVGQIFGITPRLPADGTFAITDIGDELLIDAKATEGVTLNAGKVEKWDSIIRDASGAIVSTETIGMQSNPALRPTVVGDGIVFGGPYLSVPTPASLLPYLNSGLDFFLLIDWTDTGTFAAETILSIGDPANSAAGTQVNVTRNSAGKAAISHGTGGTSVSQATVTGLHVVHARYEPGDNSVDIDGGAQALNDAVPTVSISPTGVMTIGIFKDGVSNPVNASLKRIIITQTLTDRTSNKIIGMPGMIPRTLIGGKHVATGAPHPFPYKEYYP